MLSHWVALFISNGFTPDELFAATNAIAGDSSPPRYRGEHLNRLQVKLHEAREQLRKERFTEEQKRLKEQYSMSCTCQLCGGTGWVSVPYYNDRWKLPRIENGVWVAPCQTSAVICRCPAGQALVQCVDPKRPPARLEDYETLVPHWRVYLDQQRTQRSLLKEARDKAREADKDSGPLDDALAQVCNRLKQGGS